MSVDIKHRMPGSICTLSGDQGTQHKRGGKSDRSWLEGKWVTKNYLLNMKWLWPHYSCDCLHWTWLPDRIRNGSCNSALLGKLLRTVHGYRGGAVIVISGLTTSELPKLQWIVLFPGHTHPGLWQRAVILAEKLRQEDIKFGVYLAYRMSSKLAWAI